MGLAERIDEVWIRFRAEVAEAFGRAYEVEEPAGTSVAWDELLARNGVSPIGPEERAQVRAAQRPLRGAPALELFPVVQRICKEHRIALKRIDTWDAGSGVEFKHRSLLSLIERTEKELLDAYRNAVLPKRQGMFGNVFAAGAPQPSAFKAASASALTCQWCGAPRLSDKDFQCAFCGQQMA